MNQAEISGLEYIGLHDTHAGEESYATECPQMNLDLSHKTTEFDVAMAAPAMHSVSSNSYACLDGYEHTGMMSGIQAVKEVRFGSSQHLEGTFSDSDEENVSSSPETSSNTNYGYMEQNMQNMYSALDLDEMVDKEGPVKLKPDFVFVDEVLHVQPHLMFASDGFRIEHSDCDSYEDDKTITLCWDVCDIICINSKWTQSVVSASVTLLIRPSAETKSSGPIRVEFCLKDPQWPQKQEQICHIASRYRDIWNNTPSEDLALENGSIEPNYFFSEQYFSGIGDFDDVIYPKGDPDAVSISSRDVDLLLPETFVNDTIIDFYIKYLSTRIKTTEKCRYHFFNSFFFRKLADLDKDQGRAPEGRSAFLRVRKWTRKIDIFAKDFLFIPVNFSLHWSLIVICYPGEVHTSEDGGAKKHGKVPCILHMDSLKGSHSGLKDIIQSYLWEEWKERHPESALDISDKFLNLRFVSLELPQQDNSFDCGLFLLHYVERFLKDYPSSFNPLKISVFSSFLSDGWFEPYEASLKRSSIRKLIQALVTEPSQTFPELTCGSEQFDEWHQGSEDAEHEAEFLSQVCSAGESDSAFQIPGTQQQSTSICINDSQNVPSVSGCILETGGVTTFAVQDMQVCPPDDDIVVFMRSQGVENEQLLADSDNQPDLRSCAPEGAEALKDDGYVVKDKGTCEESVRDYLHNNQRISSQAEVTVHDIMDSMCFSFSDNSQAMVHKEHNLETNITEDLDACCDGSEDMHPVVMSDAKEVDIASPDPATTKDEADNGRCDFLDVMGSVATGEIEGNISEHSLERNTVEVEEAKCDISEDTYSLMVCDFPNVMGSVVTGEIEGNTSEHSSERNTVEAEEAKGDILEDTCSPVLCDFPDVMGSVGTGEIEGNISEHSLERNTVEAEEAKGDISEDTCSLVVCDLNNDVAKHSPATIAVESVDKEHNSQAVVHKEHNLETNINEDVDDCCDGSEDIHLVGMFDAREVDIASSDPATTKDEADNGRCDFPDVMGSVATGDIEGNTSRITVEAEEAKVDISEDTFPLVLCDLSNDVAKHSPATIAVKSVDMEHEDTLVDLIVENDFEVATKETCVAADKVDDSEQFISAESKEGNIDNCVISDKTVSHELKEGETSTLVAGDIKNVSNEDHANSVDAHGNLGAGAAGEAVPCEDDTTRANDTEMPDVDSASCAKNETVREDAHCEAKRPLADSTSGDQNIEFSEDRCSEKDVESTAEKQERWQKRRKVLLPTQATYKRRRRSFSPPRF